MSGADDLAAVLEALKAAGARVSAVHVGDIRVAFASPWPPVAVPEPVRAPAEAPKDAEAAAQEERLEKLREKSRKALGRVLSDEQLLGLEGAL